MTLPDFMEFIFDDIHFIGFYSFDCDFIMHQSININQIKITSDPEQDSVVPIAFVGFLHLLDRL
jgi:hypothetical protein